MSKFVPKYVCQIINDIPQVADINDRCVEKKPIKHADYPLEYETKEECIKKCHTEKEQEALDKLRRWRHLENLKEIVIPKLKKNLSKMNDIPILNYENKIYNKNILNYNEFRSLYRILEFNDINLTRINIFFKDIISSMNGIFGKAMIIRKEIKNISTKIPKIIYIKNDEYEYFFDFLEEEYIELFNKEIDLFIKSSNQYLIKDIIITAIPFGHHTCMLIKKEYKKNDKGEDELILYIFIYDAYSNISINNNKIAKVIQKWIYDIFESRKYVFINLSTIYGLQDFEVSSGFYRIDEILIHIQDHASSINEVFYYVIDRVDSINSIINDVKDLYSKLNSSPDSLDDEDEEDKKFIEEENITASIEIEDLFVKYVMYKYFKEIYETHMFRADLERIFLNIITYKLENMSERISMDIIDDFNRTIKRKMGDYVEKAKLYYYEKNKNDEQVLNEYNMDYFDGNCYIWSYYTLILILINPTLNVYDIIRTSFYQSDDEVIIQLKYDLITNKIKENKEKKESDEYEEFYKELYNIKKTNNLTKKKVEYLSAQLIEFNRILYIKITNLILINIIYNRIDNEYLLYSMDFSYMSPIKKMIPQKVDKILNKFLFNADPITKKSIIDIIKKGQNISEINKLILGDNIVLKTHIKMLSNLSNNIENLDSDELKIYQKYKDDINWLIKKM